MPPKKPLRIKTGIMQRSLSLSKIALGAASAAAGQTVKGLFASEESKLEAQQAFLEKQAQILVQELGQLKGSLMKVGQMLGLYGEHFLPEPVVRSLKALNDQSPALAWPEIEKILESAFPDKRLEELNIEPQAMAAASMGQVHKARIKATGEEICLKIQYPGVEQAIDTDVRALKVILSLFRIAPTHHQGYEELFDEIRGMLHQELDYQKERQFTDQARHLLLAHPQFVVPRCFERYSNQRILATSYESGLSTDSQEVAGLPWEQRSAIGQDFAWLFINELFYMRMMQTDPHFGNYRIRILPDGKHQIVLLDWGAVRCFPESFVKAYREMLDAALSVNRDQLVAAGQKLGFLNETDSQSMLDSFCAISSLATEPWLPPEDSRVPSQYVDKNGCYLWSTSDLPTRLTQMASRYAFSFRLRPPPREVLFLDRKIGGMFIILKVLDARFRGHKELARWLSE